MKFIKTQHIFYLILVILIFNTSFIYGQSKKRQTQLSGQQSIKTSLTSRQIAEKVSKSIVLIVTQDAEGKPLAQGSGFFYSVPTSAANKSNGQLIDNKSNLVATNLHVFKRAWQGYVKSLDDGTIYKVKQIVGVDLLRDLCVLEIQGTKSSIPLTLGNSDQMAVGDDIYAAGNPKGLEGSFSKGIVSNIRQKLGLIQIDAAVSSGSSGGAVVNSRGEVIGVVVSSLSSGQNLNFAIPSNYLAQLPLTWQASVNAAGALAITEKEDKGLLGNVRIVITKEAEIDNSKDTPVEAEPKLKLREEYNELGESIRYTSYGNNNEVRMDIITVYDERGLMSYSSMNFKGEKREEKRYTDEENLELKLNYRSYSITKESEYISANNLKVKKAVTYDRNGREIEDIRRASDGTILKKLTKYDEEGKKIEEQRFKNGVLEEIYEFYYKIDGRGNWIRQTEFFSSPKFPYVKPIPTKVVYREITYY